VTLFNLVLIKMKMEIHFHGHILSKSLKLWIIFKRF